MSYTLEYHELVVKNDIPRLSPEAKEKIKASVEVKLTTNPETFGKPLRRSLKGYRKLRVGDYRVIFKIQGKKVKILIIDHRSTVYGKADGRLK